MACADYYTIDPFLRRRFARPAETRAHRDSRSHPPGRAAPRAAGSSTHGSRWQRRRKGSAAERPGLNFTRACLSVPVLDLSRVPAPSGASHGRFGEQVLPENGRTAPHGPPGGATPRRPSVLPLSSGAGPHVFGFDDPVHRYPAVIASRSSFTRHFEYAEKSYCVRGVSRPVPHRAVGGPSMTWKVI